MNTNSILQFCRNHVEEVLLPFWLRALDHQNGGVYTCFSNAGDRLVSTDKYTWSQGRFLWLWSKISAMISNERLHGNAVEFYSHARKTAKFLEKNVFLDNGNCTFLLTENGVKKESEPGSGFDTSIYADCFVAMGLSEVAGLSNDRKRFEIALNLYDRIKDRLQTGNFRSEPYPVPAGYRSHSFPMIMLNVTEGLGDVAEKLHHPRNEELHLLSINYMKEIMENFYQSDHTITEMLPVDVSGNDTLLHRHINPGHTIESMWFVMHASQKSGHSEYIQKASLAIERAINIGWDDEFGGLFRFVDRRGGKPKGDVKSTAVEKLIEDTWDMKLWWPHSEALYATLLSYQLTENEKMIEWYHKIHNYVFNIFPNPDESIGEWIQIRDRKGKPLDKVAALPVKDPFHILRNMLLIINLLENQVQSTQNK